MNKDSEKKSESNVRAMKNTAKWLTIIGAILLSLVYMFWLIWSLNNEIRFIEIFYGHLSAVVGIPGAIITAFVIVNVLEQVSGPIKFEGLGFKFEGASGPVIMWVIVFLSLVGGLRALW